MHFAYFEKFFNQPYSVIVSGCSILDKWGQFSFKNDSISRSFAMSGLFLFKASVMREASICVPSSALLSILLLMTRESLFFKFLFSLKRNGRVYTHLMTRLYTRLMTRVMTRVTRVTHLRRARKNKIKRGSFRATFHQCRSLCQPSR